MFARIPASSANLGPGFDVLGMALSLYAEVGAGDGERAVDDHHPAAVAFHRAGGEGSVWVRCPIPSGRGLGFSGAVRVGGIVAAHLQQHGPDPERLVAARSSMLALATELEGHPDNVAASLYGGVVAAAGGHVARVPMVLDPAMVMWVPSFVTSTDRARHQLPKDVPFADAVFNVGRTALLVAALASGDVEALRGATEDRLHQQVRLADAEPSRLALRAALDAGAWAAWLSGSGPTVAAMCSNVDATRIASALPTDGHTKVLQIDRTGAVLVDDHPA